MSTLTDTETAVPPTPAPHRGRIVTAWRRLAGPIDRPTFLQKLRFQLAFVLVFGPAAICTGMLIGWVADPSRPLPWG